MRGGAATMWLHRPPYDYLGNYCIILLVRTGAVRTKGRTMIPAAERRALREALKGMVDELFKKNGNLNAVDLQQFHAQFEDRETPRVVTLMERLVSERSFGHFGVEAVRRGDVQGDLFKCRVFLRFVELTPPGSTGRPQWRVFAFGPRRGVVVNR